MTNVSSLNPTERYKLSGSQVVVLALLCTILLITGAWAVTVWASPDDMFMSKERWIALGLGTVFSFPIGCGLVALMFYSSRNGHDEAATPKFRKHDT